MRIPEMPGRCRLLLPADAHLDNWLHARTSGIGGSEVAALLGVSPYATAFDVFNGKVDDTGSIRFLVNEPATGPKMRPELLVDDPILEWGHRLENAVAVKAADMLGLVPRTGGGLWQHLDHEVAIVTPDRVGTRPRSWRPECLIECKTSGEAHEWDDGAPIHYRIQAQWQMGITGIHTCFLGCLILGHDRDFRLVEERFDADWFGEMVEVAEKFWADHVLTGEPPMHDLAHPRTSELLKELHPHVVKPSIELPEDAADWISAYHKAKSAADGAAARLEEIKNWIRVEMGDAGAGYVGDYKAVSFPEVHTTRIDSKKLRSEYPDVAEDCSVESTYRRLTVRSLPATAAAQAPEAATG